MQFEQEGDEDPLQEPRRYWLAGQLVGQSKQSGDVVAEHKPLRYDPDAQAEVQSEHCVEPAAALNDPLGHAVQVGLLDPVHVPLSCWPTGQDEVQAAH